MQDSERDEILARITKLEAALARLQRQMDDSELAPGAATEEGVRERLNIAFRIYEGNPSAVHFQQMVETMLVYQEMERRGEA